MGKIDVSKFPAVSNTALMTLYARAMDFQAKTPILNDQFSYDLYSRIDADWKKIKRKMRKRGAILTAVRVRKYDQMCRQFLNLHPNGIIVSLGSGLDHRFGRIDNGTCILVEIDLPEVIAFKRMVAPSSDRDRLIGKSVLDFSWVAEVKGLSTANQAPVFFIAEGLMPYFEEQEVRELLSQIGRGFPQSELFFDIFSGRAVKMSSKHSGIEEYGVTLKSGFDSGHDLEALGVGFRLLEEWVLPDDPDARKGMMRLMWIIPSIKRWLYFVHGQMT